MKQKRTKEEQSILDRWLGHRNGRRGDEYNNPYLANTDNFTDYESGFAEGKAKKLKEEDHGR